MPFSSGTFSRIYNWVNEQLSSPIEISKLDAQEEDFATALNNCILRDGTGLPTAAMDWNGQNLTNVAALTATGIVTGGRFVPTSSSVPTNGMYLSAANTLAFASNTTLRLSVGSTGQWTFQAPSAGTTLNINAVDAANAFISRVLGGTNNPGLFVSHTEATRVTKLDASGSTSGVLALATSGTTWQTINESGNVTINAPSSGTTLTVNGTSGTAALAVGTKLLFGDDFSLGTGANVRAGTDVMNIGTSGAASTILFTNGQQRIIVNSAGAVTVNAPSSGASLSVTSVAGGIPIQWNDGTLTGGISLSSSQVQFGATSNHAASFYTNNLTRVSIAAAGNVTINAPSSGTAFSVTGASGLLAANFQGAAADSVRVEVTKGGGTAGTDSFALIQDTGSVARLFNRANAAMDFSTNGTQRVNIAAGGAVTINAPSSGVGLTIAGGGLTVTGTITGDGSGLTTLSATNLSSGTVNTARISGSYTGITAIGAATINDSGGSPFNAGYLGMPQSTNTSLVLTDRGKHILLSGTTNTVTIPANASVAFEVGSTIVLVNDGSGNTTLNITTDTLDWFQGGAVTTGSGRTIATKSLVTLVKVASTRWVLSGSGIS